MMINCEIQFCEIRKLYEIMLLPIRIGSKQSWEIILHSSEPSFFKEMSVLSRAKISFQPLFFNSKDVRKRVNEWKCAGIKPSRKHVLFAVCKQDIHAYERLGVNATWMIPIFECLSYKVIFPTNSATLIFPIQSNFGSYPILFLRKLSF